MSAPLTPANDTWNGDPIAPDEGEEVTAVTAAPGKGPVRPAFQRLLDKIWSVVNGKVTIRALDVGPGAGTPANLLDGRIRASDLIAAPDFAGDQALMSNYLRIFNLFAPIGTATLEAGRLAFTGVTAAGNPARTASLKNEVRPLNTIKSFVIIRTTEVPTVLDGAAVVTAQINWTGAVTEVTVTLTDAMASDVYAVTPPLSRLVSDGSFVGWTKFVRLSSTQYKITYNADLTLANYEISMMVMGRQS